MSKYKCIRTFKAKNNKNYYYGNEIDEQTYQCLYHNERSNFQKNYEESSSSGFSSSSSSDYSSYFSSDSDSTSSDSSSFDFGGGDGGGGGATGDW
jgi:hypothetical protein